MAEQDASTLYYFPFSLYSLMVRLGFEIAATLDPETAPKYSLKFVNLHEDEEVSEWYLTKISSRGQVPSLISPSLSSHLTDSRDISNWLCEQQPQLVPSEHRETIERLMEGLYAFHAMALTIPEEGRLHGVPNLAAAILERSDISEEYRRALEMKSMFHDTNYSRTLESSVIEETEELCRQFTSDLNEVLLQRPEGTAQGVWLLGDSPTIIDAHAVPMIARLLDVKKDDFVPEAVQTYARGVMGTEAWARTTHGRKTMFDRSYGPARDLTPL